MEQLDDPQVFLPDVFATHATFQPEEAAVVCGPVSRSWGDFDANMNRVANSLRARGLKKGDKVAVVMGNAVEMLEVTFGVVKAGGCVVPLSGMLTAEQQISLMEDSDACFAFVSEAYAGPMEPLRQSLTKIAAEHWIGFGFEAEGWIPYPAFLEGTSAEAPNLRYDNGDDFNIIYSSGTTGLPKGIVQTHRARTHWAFSNAIEMGFTSNSRALSTTPLYSNGTWLVMLPVLFAGGTLHVMPAFDATAFLEIVEREQITHSFMVPAQYVMVLAEESLDRRDLSSLRTLLSAGSPLRRDTKQEIVERLCKGLIELYGFSEGFATMLKPKQPARKFASVGTPVLGFEVAILDEEGNELPRGEVGEIAGYGAGLMKGYHKRPDETADLIWRDPRGRSFLRSGDIGKLDEDGFLYILDRKKDMIISGGFNVFATDVEGVIGKHPAVRDVTVIGVPDARWGESCQALVIPEPGQAADPEAIKTWANERLAKPQRLKAVELREDFPRNALGKVMKRVLRQPYWQDQD